MFIVFCLQPCRTKKSLKLERSRWMKQTKLLKGLKRLVILENPHHLLECEVLIDLFYVTSCNTTFLGYAEDICRGGHTWWGWNIPHTGDRSTFVSLRQWHKGGLGVCETVCSIQSFHRWKKNSPNVRLSFDTGRGRHHQHWCSDNFDFERTSMCCANLVICIKEMSLVLYEPVCAVYRGTCECPNVWVECGDSKLQSQNILCTFGLSIFMIIPQTEQLVRVNNEMDTLQFSLKKASKLVKEIGRQVRLIMILTFSTRSIWNDCMIGFSKLCLLRAQDCFFSADRRTNLRNPLLNIRSIFQQLRACLLSTNHMI